MFQRVLSIYKEFLFQFQGFLFPITSIISLQHTHNELPSVVLPYKHYDSEVISGVLEKVVTPDDLDSEDYPCGATMLLWIQWLQKNLERIEGYLRAVAYELSDYDSRILHVGASLLASLQKSNRRWLEQVIRTIYNSGGFLVPFRR